MTRVLLHGPGVLGPSLPGIIAEWDAALSEVSRTLLRPGDAVLVDEPGWAVEFARLAQLGMRILPVPRRADGPYLAVLARYSEPHQPLARWCSRLQSVISQRQA